MWDDTRKVGILNDFDLARFADQVGASGQDNTGTLPFMALDLLSKKGLRGETPRRYRHEAESFAWCLICLYFATVEDGKGKNCTRNPHPFLKWFQSWDICFNNKYALKWHRLDLSGVPQAYPTSGKYRVSFDEVEALGRMVAFMEALRSAFIIDSQFQAH